MKKTLHKITVRVESVEKPRYRPHNEYTAGMSGEAIIRQRIDRLLAMVIQNAGEDAAGCSGVTGNIGPAGRQVPVGNVGPNHRDKYEVNTGA